MVNDACIEAWKLTQENGIKNKEHKRYVCNVSFDAMEVSFFLF